MRPIYSVLTVFYILDHCYALCEEDALGAFLGMISPEIWTDGLPSDKAIYDDWKESVEDKDVTEDNVLEWGLDFVKAYGKRLDFDFSQTIAILQKPITKDVIAEAMQKAEEKCRRHQYTW